MDQDQIGAYDDCLVILDDDEEEVSVSKDASVDCIVIDDDEEEEISDSKGRIKTESELNIPYNKGDGYDPEKCKDSSPPMDIQNEDTTTPGTSKVGPKKGSPQPKPALREESVLQEHSFQCSDCDKSFKYIHQLNNHTKTHRGDRPFKCDKCIQSFKKADHLERHILRHLGEKYFTCSVCGKSFIQFYELKKHSKLHFKERPFQCSQCGKGFTELSVLKVHLAAHARKKRYGCMICGEEFLILENLKFHRQHAHQDPKIPEGVKINLNKIENNLKDESVKGESQFYCSECGKGFSALSYLKRHLKEHGMMFQCAQCLKGFTELPDLKVHLATHAKKIEYRCSKCGRDFLALENLNFHYQYTHKDLAAPPKIPECVAMNIKIGKNLKYNSVKVSQFNCPECGKNFCTASNLKKHLMSHAKLFKCSECGKSFRRHKRLVKHLLEHE